MSPKKTRPNINPRVLYTFLSALVILLGTLVAIQYAKGNFRVTKQGVIANTGLLSANSFPPGGELYIDDKLVSATDDTVYLEPGSYWVKIEKEGYLPWQKQLELKSELVTQTNATLFPQVPSLVPLTFSGVENVQPSPDGQKLLYFTASASAETKRGLYVLELTDNPLSLQRGARQISNNPNSINLATANIIWSPDSSQVMALAMQKETLLATDRQQDLAAATDISFQRHTMLSEWEEEMYIRERQFLGKFPPEVIEVATQSAKNVYLSPDKQRLLYTATASATLPDNLVPPPPATNTQPEFRTLVPGAIYVYDREEDKNFQVGQETGQVVPSELHSEKALLATDLHQKEPLSLVASPSAFTRLQATSSAQLAARFRTYHSSLYAPTLQWFPDSKHLVYTTTNQVHIMEYDGTNDTVIYSGPFVNDFVYPWPDGSKLVILTRFSPETPLNLYAVELK